MRVLLFFSVLLLIYGCNTDSLKISQYSNGLEDYFSNTFELSSAKLNSCGIFIIPVASCTPCVVASLDLVLTRDPGKTFIFTIGASSETGVLRLLQKVRDRYKVYQDIENELKYYRTNIGSPWYFEVRRGRFYGIELKEENIKTLKKSNYKN